MKQWKEKGMEILFLLAACVSILAVILICVFLFANGIPGMAKIGVFKFLAGEKWKPGNDIYGILPMILGSIYVTVGAIIIGVPVGIFTAVFMAKFCPKKIYPYLKQAMVSCLPDKRAPGGAPFLVRVFAGGVCLGGNKAVAERW